MRFHRSATGTFGTECYVWLCADCLGTLKLTLLHVAMTGALSLSG